MQIKAHPTKEKEFCFEVYSPLAHAQDIAWKNHVTLLAAESFEDMEAWIEALQQISEEAKVEIFFIPLIFSSGRREFETSPRTSIQIRPRKIDICHQTEERPK